MNNLITRFCTALGLFILLSSCASMKDSGCMTNVLAGGLLFGGSNCSQAAGEKFQFDQTVEKGHKIVYFYRNYSSILGVNDVVLQIDEVASLNISHRGFKRISLVEDKLHVKIVRSAPVSSSEYSEIIVNLENQINFLRVTPVEDGERYIYVNGVLTSVPIYKYLLKEVPQNVALNELEDTHEI